jgi:hypothetical protein
MQLRTPLIAPAIDAKWFSQFIDELEREARALEFDAGGYMNPPTSLRLVSGKHATQGARYELTNTLPSGTESKDDLVVDEWTSNVIAVTNTHNDDVSHVRFTRDTTFGLRRVDVEMSDRSGSGLSLKAHVDLQRMLTSDGEFSVCRIKHRIALGEIALQRTVVENDWRIDAVITTRGRGPLRPLLAVLLVLIRPLISLSLRKGIKQIGRRSVPQLQTYLKKSTEEAAHDVVHAWLAAS